MADIKLIVKIDADVYTRLFDNGIQDNEIATDDICEMARALRLGKPLPKGHGRLIDADAMINAFVYTATVYDACNLEEMLEEMPTIIEADKGEE